MDIKNKAMFRLLLGFTLGLIIGIIMYLAYIPDGSPIDKKYLVAHLIGSSLMGLIGYGGAIVYDIEKLSLGMATLSHYIATLLTFLIVNALLGWFPKEVMLIVFIAFTIAYILIWLFEYLIWKKQVRQMNQNLEAMLKSDEKE